MQALTDLAADHGTPLYVFDGAAARARAARLRDELGVLVRFAAKANRTPVVLEALRPAVDGVDVTSEGELEAALEAGFAGTSVSVTGPGKTDGLLQRAAETGARIAIGSVAEARRLALIAPGAEVVLRINPSLLVHAFRTRAGGAATPFGLPEEELPGALAELAAVDVRPIGVHVHRGSQCTSVAGWMKHAADVFDITHRLADAIDLRVVSLGGGFGVARPGMSRLDMGLLGRRLRKAAAAFRAAHEGVTLEVEPGRWIAADAGTLLLRVVDVRRVRGTTFVVLDGGMDAFLFACAWFRKGPPFPARNLSRRGDAGPVTLVGPACTPMDTLGEVTLALPHAGDVIAIEQAGAYAAGASLGGFLGRRAIETIVV